MLNRWDGSGRTYLPVTKLPPSEARYDTRPAISSGVPIRGIGVDKLGYSKVLYQAQSFAEIETVLTTTRSPPGFASLGPFTADHPSTGRFGLSRVFMMKEKGPTHASINDTRSIRVNSNAVFAEFLRFKCISSNHEQGHWFNERHTGCLRQTANSKLGCRVSGSRAGTCSHDVNEFLSFHTAIVRGNLVCPLLKTPLIMVHFRVSMWGREEHENSAPMIRPP